LYHFNVLYGKSENSVETVQVSSDTVRISVRFSEPEYRPRKNQSGVKSSNEAFVTSAQQCFYIQSGSDDLVLKEISRTSGDAAPFSRVQLVEDVPIDGIPDSDPAPETDPDPDIVKEQVAESNGIRLFLVRLNPYSGTAVDARFSWFNEMTIRCTGKNVKVLKADSSISRWMNEFSASRKSQGKLQKSDNPDSYPKSPCLKIRIHKEGLYFIPQPLVRNAGWDVSSVDPRYFRIRGIRGEIPIRVIGEEDGSFDMTDGLEFFGEPPWNTDKPGQKRLDVYSNENIYWLELGDKPGRRMAEETGSPSNERESIDYERSFPFLGHEEKDYAFLHLPDADPSKLDDAEYWLYTFGPAGSQSEEIPFLLDSPDSYAAQLVSFRLKIRGQTKKSGPQPFDVILNDRLVLSDAWYENEAFEFSSPEFSPTFLKEGGNKLILVNRSPDREASRFFLDWFEITYPRLYKASYNYIRFRAPSNSTARTCHFKIDGFTDPSVNLYKINTSRIVGGIVQTVTDSLGKVTYSLTFQDDVVNGETEYVALSSKSKVLPDSVEYIRSMPLHSRGRGADYIVITPSDSLGRENLSDWITLRERQGFKVEVADLDSIYNEFNFGIPNPKAIRGFLSYTKLNWNPPPRFVLLIGDGNIDSRSASLKGNMMPFAWFPTTKYGAAASDFWYSLLDDDFLPDLAIGRWPVRTQDELRAVAAKTIEYEASRAAPWKNRYLMIGAGSSSDVFGVQSKNLIQNVLPSSLHSERLFLVGNPADPDVGGTETLLRHFSEGLGWINFRGHGGGAIWADAGLMDLDDAKLIENKGKLPIITSMTCFTADFSSGQNCLGEALVDSKDNGAVAFFGSTSVGWVDTDFGLLKILSETLTAEPGLTLGEMIQQTKTRFYIENQENLGHLATSEIHQYNLLGDPALHFTFPSGEASVELEKRSLTASDSLHVYGSSLTDQTQVLFEITDSQNRVQSSMETAFQQKNWNAKIPLPSGFSANKGGLRTYQWDAATGTHARSFDAFAFESGFFDSVTTIPPDPTSADSIRIRVIAENRDAITRAWCHFYRPTAANLPLSLDKTPHSYVSASAAGPFPPGTVAVYKIFAESATGLSESDSMTIRIPTLPDLFVNSLVLGGSSRVVLETQVFNFGQQDAKSVRVRFESPDLNWSAEDTVDCGGNSHVPVSVVFNPIPGQFRFIISVNPDSSILENRYENDAYSKEIMMDSFNATAEGSFSGLTAPQNVGITTVGNFSRVSCIVPPGILTKPSVLRIQPEYKVDETSTDPAAEVQILYHVQFIEYPEDPAFLKDFTVSFIGRTSATAAQLKPFRWDSTVKRWTLCDYVFGDSTFVVRTRRPGVFTFLPPSDSTPPMIEILTENQPFADGSYVPSNPRFTILLQDQSGIDVNPEKIQVYLDESLRQDGTVTLPDSIDNPSAVTVAFRPELSSGEHTIRIRASDVNGNTTQTDLIRFLISEQFDVQYLGNHPNPFRLETVFAYVLTESAERLNIKIYTVAGRLIRTFDDPGLASADYHEVEWDGNDERGEEIANGVYFFRIQAAKGKDQKEFTGKIAKMR
jgi:hypothetical protein